MSNIIQQTIFPGSGLNTDDDMKYLPNGDSPYRLNIMISGDEAHGIITNMLGNTRTIDITDHLLTLSNVYVTIGSYYNRLTRKCYYFIFTQPYDSDGSGDYLYDNKLFCYNEDQQTLDLIFTDTKNYFGLDINYLIKDCEMVDDWLYFNPRNSEPKMIDVVRAYNYTNYDAYDPLGTYVYGDICTYYGGLFQAVGTAYVGETPVVTPAKWDRIGNNYQDNTGLDFDSEFRYAFNVIKMPPVERPDISYSTDTTFNSNNVRGKLFRFAYRYKYFDNSYSVYSAYSDISLPEDSEKYNGEILNEVYFNNVISVTVFPHSAALIKEIEIIFQETGSDWKRAKVFNRIEQVNIDQLSIVYNFYNNESYMQVPLETVLTIEDYVPRKAKSQTIVNKNVLAFGGCLEGFSNLDKNDIQVSLTPVLDEFTTPDAIGAIRRDNVAAGDVDLIRDPQAVYTSSFSFNSWYATAGIIANDKYTVVLNNKESTHTITGGDIATIDAFVTAICTFLTTTYSEFTIAKNLTTHVITVSHATIRPIFKKSVFYYAAVTGVTLYKKRGFKTGANHPFCIFYYDGNLRRWDAQVSKENIPSTGWTTLGTSVYVPMFNEESSLPTTTACRYTIEWEVNHMPPAGAKYWRWGYAGNALCSQMVQYIIKAISNSNPVLDGPALCKIDITPLQTLKTTLTTDWNQFGNSKIDAYAWEPGDRVRFLTNFITPGAGTSMGAFVNGVYDFEIIKQSEDGLTIYTQQFDFTVPTPDIGENSLIEIYRPLKRVSDTRQVFYEFGDIMPIMEDSVGVMVHAGQGGAHNQDTGTSTAALGSFDGGDIFHIYRTPSKPLDTTTTTKGAFHESMWWSDFYASDDHDRGRMGIETTFGERQLNIIRYSNQYIQNTQINGLHTFEGDSIKEMNDIYGDIIRIIEQGDTLKVYQERKASSILIGRTEYYDTGGNNVTVNSERVFGAIRYSASNYSTVFAESVDKNNKFIYGFDIYNGVVWRDSVNGLFPISGRYAEAGGDADYKMQTYFKLKAKALLESGIDHVDIIGTWDEEYKLFYLTFKDFVLETNNETIVFHEPSNRWITFAEFFQTPIEGYNVILELDYTVVKGFDAGIGFSFNEDTRFAEFNIATPPNVNPAADLAELAVTAYEPTVTVDCIPSADLAEVTITAYDPFQSRVSLAPDVILSYIEDIPIGMIHTTMLIFVHYQNLGDGTLKDVTWRIKDDLGGVTASGTQTDANFSAEVMDGSVTLTGLLYEKPEGNYTVEVSIDGWGSLLTQSFTSSNLSF